MLRTTVACVWTALPLAVLSVVTMNAATQRINRQEARPLASVEGVDTFKAYCATCHGVSGKGDGPAAKALKKTPADLTTIARRHGGTFSSSDVEKTIVGNEVVESHGSRDMPIWGPVFRSIAADDSFMKLRMANLVECLKSIQAK